MNRATYTTAQFIEAIKNSGGAGRERCGKSCVCAPRTPQKKPVERTQANPQRFIWGTR
jgi:hypothetical protein